MIRAATLADINQLYELAVSMVDQSNFMPYGVNRDKFNTFASALITHGFVAVFDQPTPFKVKLTNKMNFLTYVQPRLFEKPK